MIFTVEEATLTAAFDHSSRSAAIKDMLIQFGLIEDEELKAQVASLIEKLDTMSDAEFSKLDFSVYEEDDNEHMG